MLLFLLLLVPAILAVAGLSGNYPQHVLGTAVLFALPLMACVGFLHPVVAGLLRRQRTPLQEACREYLSELSPPSQATIPTEDQDHPKNQGLSILALQYFWEHFRRFILDRTMHFVVANIVEPLTEKQQTSLVGLLQGKAVSHFVSHSWATPFQHFVQCLQRHAAFTGAVNPTYWICSFANNQWDIASEIGTDVLDSAFAKVLYSASAIQSKLLKGGLYNYKKGSIIQGSTVGLFKGDTRSLDTSSHIWRPFGSQGSLKDVVCSPCLRVSLMDSQP